MNKMENVEKLSNAHVDVEFDPADSSPISGSDHDDQNNLPAFYIQNKRGAKAQWNILKSKFNENTTFNDVCATLRDNGAKLHRWCSMD